MMKYSINLLKYNKRSLLIRPSYYHFRFYSEGIPKIPETPKVDPIIESKGEVKIEEKKDAEEKLTTIFGDNDPYMDTNDVYKKLVLSGFSSDQADELIYLLCEQLNSKLSRLSTVYSEKAEFDNDCYLFESAQQEIRVDITRSRENHLNESLASINILNRDFRVLSDEITNLIIQMKNENQVAINEQNSENTLTSKRMFLTIQEMNHRITTEINSAMRSEIETLRWHLSRWGLTAILIVVFLACCVYYLKKVWKARRELLETEFVPLVVCEPSELEDDDDEFDTDID